MTNYRERGGILCMLCWIDARQPFFSRSSFLTTYTKQQHTHTLHHCATRPCWGGEEGLRIQGILRNEIPTTTTTPHHTTTAFTEGPGQAHILGGAGGHICFIYFVDGNKKHRQRRRRRPLPTGVSIGSIRCCVRTRQPTTRRLDIEMTRGLVMSSVRLIFFPFRFLLSLPLMQSCRPFWVGWWW